MAVPIEEARQRLRGPRLVPFKDIRPAVASTYLVKGLVPADGLTVVWGPPKSGKSFLAFDIAMSVARECPWRGKRVRRSEEHTSELQSLMRISYAVFCLKKKTTTNTT